MDRRGIALIMVLLTIAVIAVLLSSFFFGVMNDNRLVSRYVNSTRAFWLAEAGIAEAQSNMPDSVSGTLQDANYAYSATTTNIAGEYYQIDATGSVDLGASGLISRSLRAIVRTDPVDPNNFQHAIRTTSELVVKGSVTINGPQEEYASLNFADLFEHSKEEVRSYATHLYTDPPT